jgi:hypothetical protein
MALDRLILVQSLANPPAVELSVVMRVGWVCSLSSSFRICRMWAASWPLWKRVPVSASEADDITFFMMRLSMWIGVLGWGLSAGSSLPPR